MAGEIGIPNPKQKVLRCEHLQMWEYGCVAVVHTEDGHVIVETCRACMSKGVRGVAEDDSILLAAS